ncbi:MAG: hypothetical protein DRQ61_01435 [Gammaproteobacteria bacterium]|nr:MAG: hypothetical protein DRQ56_00375 [Gammaproteobacteria bacterium]RLA24280.1 MAG: hypothetical protein DRQ61_01435 [Gammaproteobacteria bacterium]
MVKKLAIPEGNSTLSVKLLSVVIGMIVFAGLVTLAIVELGKEELLPIKFVRVEGDLRYIDRGEIKTEIEPLLKRSFLALDMEAVSQAVESLPWVDSARIARLWPDTLEINLVEQVPYLKWGKSSYLNRRGERFASAGRTVAKALPELFGKAGQEKVLLAQFEKISDALMKQEMKIKTFRVTDRQAWQIELENETEILLGRDQPALAFDRLIRSVSLLGSERLQRIVRIDMRYPNGFAVRWKETELKKDEMNSFLQDRKNA